MSFNREYMGMAESIALAYGVAIPLVFLSTPAFLAEMCGPLSWLTPITGGLIAGGLLWLQQFMLNKYPGDLLELSEQLAGRIAKYFIGFFYTFAMFATACLWTRQFAENTLLVGLPLAEFSNVILVYGLSAVALIYLGIETIARVIYLILPFMVGGLLLVLLGLTPIIRPLYLFPLLGNGLSAVFKPTMLFVGASAPTVIIMMLAPAFQNTKTLQTAIIFGFGGSVVIRSLANAVYVAVFSAAVALEKTLPFYEMARVIYINRYVQRLEALFILLWVMVGILGIAVCLYGAVFIIVRLFNLSSRMPILLPMGLIMINLASVPSSGSEVSLLGINLFIYILAPGFFLSALFLQIVAWFRGGNRYENKA